MHIFNAGGSARWGPVPFMKKNCKILVFSRMQFMKKAVKTQQFQRLFFSESGARRETRTLTLFRRGILSPLRLPFRHPGEGRHYYRSY